MDKIEDNPVGKAIIGIVLGLGIASLFRKTCKDASCVIVRGPHPNELRDHVYRIDGDCYKYTPRPTRCVV